MHIAVFLVALMQQGGIAPTTPKQPEWYEKVTGVIAIPAAIIACAYSYLLIKKTRLESRKIELEIEQQRQAAATSAHTATSSAPSVALSETVEQALKNRLLLIVIVRFILWRLVDECYGWIISPLKWILTIAIIPISQIFSKSNVLGHVPDFIKYGFLAVAVTFQAAIESVGSFVIFLAFGWPLFKDINQLLGINLRDYRPIHLLKSAIRRK